MELVTPGIYYDMENEAYHRSAGISKSGLALFAANPEKYYWRYVLGNREPSKPQYAIGSAFHTATLEPNKFDAHYVVGSDVNKNTNIWKAFVASNSDRTILGKDDYDTVMAMAERVRKHPIAGNLISEGYAEASVFATDPETGELVKVRPDWVTEDIICDLKSTTDASPSKFFRDMFSYTYYMQAGMYPEVFNMLGAGPRINDFVFICVEKEPPYSIAVYRASEQDREIGLQSFRRNLRRFSIHKKANSWPSYNDDKVVDTELPAWAKREEEARELNDPSASF